MGNHKREGHRVHQIIYKTAIKRIVDTIAAFVLLLITSPFVLLGILVIKLDSKGPAFFKQKRVGKGCKEFSIYKLRTMDEIPHDDEGKKRKDRERITRAGRIIRKLSLDELPQLMNIIKGEMSFVGPRPLLIRYLPYYTEEEMKRHDVLPGITGLAQINGRSFLDWEERFAFDVEYVNHLSFKLDVQILMKTVGKVFVGEGTSTERPKTLVDFDEHRNFKALR